MLPAAPIGLAVKGRAVPLVHLVIRDQRVSRGVVGLEVHVVTVVILIEDGAGQQTAPGHGCQILSIGIGEQSGSEGGDQSSAVWLPPVSLLAEVSGP
jgi:hypothetical protein